MIINNINVKTKKCYETKITESSKELRIRSINKCQQRVESIKADTTLAEWNKLKQHGIYETELADIAIIAVAWAIHKDILVFNTNGQQSISPIYAINVEQYQGGTRNNSNPIITDHTLSHLTQSVRKMSQKP